MPFKDLTVRVAVKLESTSQTATIRTPFVLRRFFILTPPRRPTPTIAMCTSSFTDSAYERFKTKGATPSAVTPAFKNVRRD